MALPTQDRGPDGADFAALHSLARLLAKQAANEALSASSATQDGTDECNLDEEEGRD
ncbi:MAG: hypothetical protein AAFR01_08195 [Pseudomonadota bacterium]